MIIAPFHPNEDARLKSLLSYDLIGTPPEEKYDELLHLARFIAKTPIGIISLIDRTHQWYKAKVGVTLDQVPRNLTFCSHTILGSDLMEVCDATLDERFFDNPAVTGSLKLRYYIGFPLINSEGFPPGTLCLVSPEPGKLSEEQIKMLKIIVKQIVSHFESSKNKQILQKTQEQLTKIAKMASLGEMAGGIAHEINNPLMVIIGKIFQTRRYMKKNQLSNPEIEGNLSKIDETAKRISKIVNGLRSFSKNSDFLETEVIALSILLQDTLSICEEKFRYHNVEFILKVPKVDPRFECRAVQISQVLINLFNNSFDAIKNNEKKWIQLEVYKTKNEIKFKVTDSGNGISESIVEKLMTPFFTTKEAGQGTGLGLSICRDIIKSHKGNLFFDKESSNTCFIFTLPLKQN